MNVLMTRKVSVARARTLPTVHSSSSSFHCPKLIWEITLRAQSDISAAAAVQMTYRRHTMRLALWTLMFQAPIQSNDTSISQTAAFFQLEIHSAKEISSRPSSEAGEGVTKPKWGKIVARRRPLFHAYVGLPRHPSSREWFVQSSSAVGLTEIYFCEGKDDDNYVSTTNKGVKICYSERYAAASEACSLSPSFAAQVFGKGKVCSKEEVEKD